MRTTEQSRYNSFAESVESRWQAIAVSPELNRCPVFVQREIDVLGSEIKTLRAAVAQLVASYQDVEPGEKDELSRLRATVESARENCECLMDTLGLVQAEW